VARGARRATPRQSLRSGGTTHERQPLGPFHVCAEPDGEARKLGCWSGHQPTPGHAYAGQRERSAASETASRTAGCPHVRAAPQQGGKRVSLPLDLLRKLSARSSEAWADLFAHAWAICSPHVDISYVAQTVGARDRALGDADLVLAAAGWDLWLEY